MYFCPICNRESKLLYGMLVHSKKKHKISREDLYLKYVSNGIRKTCKCGCGELTTFKNYEYGYNDYKFGHAGNFSHRTEEEATSIRDKKRKNLIGKEGWSKGLTKENSDIIKKRGENISKTQKAQFKSGERVCKLKGQTKETNEALMKMSVTMKEQFSSGEKVPWMKGKTKDTDPRIAAMAEKVKFTLREDILRKRLDALKRLSPSEIIKRLEERAPNLKLITDFSSYTNDQDKNLTFKCVKCNTESTRSLASALTNRCFICDPVGSQKQIEIKNFVQSITKDEVLCSARSILSANARIEADIYIPSKKFAIEYNGLYFHSSVHKTPYAHAEKLKLFNEEGIQLFYIFEDEWREKQEIVKSMIAHKIGLTTKKIFARKCEIKKISGKERKCFFDLNHIDGDSKAEVAFGLFFNNELICAISARTPFHKKYNTNLEVARFACKTNLVCVGGLSRLMKMIVNYAKSHNFTAIMTYVDERHGLGNSYLSAGFILTDKTTVRFWWTDFYKRFNRFKYRANKSLDLTENDVAIKNNVYKIWGCENRIYFMNI